MAVAPMHVITKPEAGTGGSYLQDLTSAIATSSTDTDWLRLVATLDDGAKWGQASWLYNDHLALTLRGIHSMFGRQGRRF